MKMLARVLDREDVFTDGVAPVAHAHAAAHVRDDRALEAGQVLRQEVGLGVDGAAQALARQRQSERSVWPR